MDKKPLLWKWQHVLPIVLLFLSTAWAFNAAYLQKDKGRLDFSLDSVSKIATLANKKVEGLKIFFHDKEVTDVSVARVYIANSGNISLYERNIKNPLSVENPRFKIIFDPEIKILKSFITPVNTTENIVLTEFETNENEHNEVSFKVELMNINSAAYIDFVVSGFPKTYQREVSGLNLTSREVTSNSHLVPAKWWHYIIVIFISAWPLFLVIKFKTWLWKLEYKIESELLRSFIAPLAIFIATGLSLGTYILMSNAYNALFYAI